MPRIETWDNLLTGVRQHLIDRMRDRAIGIADLNHLQSGSTRIQKCRKAIGTGTSGRSRSAAVDRCRRRFCCVVKPLRGQRSKWVLSGSLLLLLGTASRLVTGSPATVLVVHAKLYPLMCFSPFGRKSGWGSLPARVGPYFNAHELDVHLPTGRMPPPTGPNSMRTFRCGMHYCSLLLLGGVNVFDALVKLLVEGSGGHFDNCS